MNSQSFAMKPQVVFAFLCFVVFVSCKPKGTSPKELGYHPMHNGFGVVVKSIGIDSGPGAKLYYKGTNENPSLVWPCIGTWGGSDIIHKRHSFFTGRQT